jgi:hypothetical protein
MNVVLGRLVALVRYDDPVPIAERVAVEELLGCFADPTQRQGCRKSLRAMKIP